MNKQIESLCQEIRTKLDGLDKRIKALNVSAKGAAEKTRTEAKAQLAVLEKHARDHRAKVLSAEAKAKAWLDEKKTTTTDQIAAWKAQHDNRKLALHAESAENYALASMQLAMAAVDEAERAAVEAVVARIDADGARMAPAKSA